jgi:hypothetical protein
VIPLTLAIARKNTQLHFHFRLGRRDHCRNKYYWSNPPAHSRYKAPQIKDDSFRPGLADESAPPASRNHCEISFISRKQIIPCSENGFAQQTKHSAASQKAFLSEKPFRQPAHGYVRLTNASAAEQKFQHAKNSLSSARVTRHVFRIA